MDALTLERFGPIPWHERPKKVAPSVIAARRRVLLGLPERKPRESVKPMRKIA